MDLRTKVPMSLTKSEKQHKAGVFRAPSNNPMNHFSTQYSTAFTRKTLIPSSEDPEAARHYKQSTGYLRNESVSSVTPVDTNSDWYAVKKYPYPFQSTGSGYGPGNSTENYFDENTQAHPVSCYRGSFGNPQAKNNFLTQGQAQNSKHHKGSKSGYVRNEQCGVEMDPLPLGSTTTYGAAFERPPFPTQAERTINAQYIRSQKEAGYEVEEEEPVVPGVNCNWKQATGYIKNNTNMGDILTSELSRSEQENHYLTTYNQQMTARFDAPKSAVVPTVDPAIKKQYTSFSRSEMEPPCVGVGTDELKLNGPKLHGAIPNTGERQYTVSSHGGKGTYVSGPLSREAAQDLVELRELARVDPIALKHILNGANPMTSTYKLSYEQKMPTARDVGIPRNSGVCNWSNYGLQMNGRKSSQTGQANDIHLQNSFRDGGFNDQKTAIYASRDAGAAADKRVMRAAWRPHVNQLPLSSGYTQNADARVKSVHKLGDRFSDDAGQDDGHLTTAQCFDHPAKPRYTLGGGMHRVRPGVQTNAFAKDSASDVLNTQTINPQINTAVFKTGRREGNSQIFQVTPPEQSKENIAPTVMKMRALNEPNAFKDYGQNVPRIL